MSMDLTGITNKNEYYTNHYFSTVFEENAGDTISAWNAVARESEEIRTPWSMLGYIISSKPGCLSLRQSGFGVKVGI